MALRMSMEEEHSRLERERRQREEQERQNGERMETITEEGGASSADNKQPRVEDEKPGDGK